MIVRVLLTASIGFSSSDSCIPHSEVWKMIQSGLVCIVSCICVFWYPNFKAITVTSITHVLVDQKPWEILTNSRRV